MMQVKTKIKQERFPARMDDLMSEQFHAETKWKKCTPNTER